MKSSENVFSREMLRSYLEKTRHETMFIVPAGRLLQIADSFLFPLPVK